VAGLRDFEATGWFGVYGPRGLPEPLVTRQNAALNRTLANTEVQARLRTAGATVLGGTAQAFGDFNRREVARWSALIRRLGVSVD
jgi:tripartite-type tricarboxylate transporter receptor subunit TctC